MIKNKIPIILSVLLLCLVIGYQNCGQVNLQNTEGASQNLPNYMSLDNNENKTHKILAYECPQDGGCDLAIVSAGEFVEIQAKGKKKHVNEYPSVEYDFFPNKVGEEAAAETVCKAVSFSTTSKVIINCPASVFEGKGFFIEL